MSQPFPVSGSIDRVAFPHLIVDLHRQHATGSLKVSGPTHPKALYFRAGRILFGSSNDPKDQLGSILVESGRITRQQLDEVSAKVGPGRPLAKVLSETGFVNQRELGDAARVKLERILADVLSWQSGSFEFEDGVLPKGAVDLKLSTERLLLAAVRRIGDRAFALRHVGLDDILQPHPDDVEALNEIRPDVAPLLDQLDGRRTLREAIDRAHLDEFEGAKTACALLLLGIVRQREEPAEVDLAGEAQSAFAILDEEPAARVPGEEPPIFSTPAPEPEVTAPSFSVVEPDDQPAAFAEAPAPTVFLAAEPLTAAAEPPAMPVESAPDIAPDAPTFIMGGPPPDLPGPESPPTLRMSADAESRAPATAAPREGEQRPAGKGLPRPPGAIDRPASAGRSSQDDLAALDALLKPPASEEEPASPSLGDWNPDAEPGSTGESESGKWQPQVRTAAYRRRPPAKLQSSGLGASRAVIVGAAVLAVLLTTVAAWYFFLRSPARATPPRTAARPPAVRPSPRPTGAPVALPASPAPAATTAALPSPTAAPTASPRAPATASTTAQPPRPTPTPTPAATVQAPGRPAAPAGPTAAPRTSLADARALLSRGSLPEAASAFERALSTQKNRYTLQVLTACSPETVQKAATGTAGAEELLVLNVAYRGRSCYRVLWGLYDSSQAAQAAQLPPYFRQGGVQHPRVSSVSELLP